LKDQYHELKITEAATNAVQAVNAQAAQRATPGCVDDGKCRDNKPWATARRARANSLACSSYGDVSV
jgi:hypothetical protein